MLVLCDGFRWKYRLTYRRSMRVTSGVKSAELEECQEYPGGKRGDRRFGDEDVVTRGERPPMAVLRQRPYAEVVQLSDRQRAPPHLILGLA
jgi:hypothetical protein